MAMTVEIIILLLIISLISLIVVKQRQKCWIRKSWLEYEVKEGDDINFLASGYSVSWGLIAKANKLAAPYILTAGQKIKLPPKK